MAGLTSFLTGSFIAKIPRKVPPSSNSEYLLISESVASILFSFKSFKAPPSYIAPTARILRPSPAYF
jgi:hypothetical protein